ncbi:S8 family serine peptidase, partial [Escherichia coli]|uniref:S8 family serine peptidase n=1 Tax=Escherichia coli TaxID=562 RepID=UPI0019338F22
VVDNSLARINASAAYARGFSGLGVLVAVGDTGLDANHPAFSGRISDKSIHAVGLAPGQDPKYIYDTEEHGTYVSGIAAASIYNVKKMGVAYDSSLMS